VYNTKDAKPYLARIQSRKSSRSHLRRLQNNGNGGDKVQNNGNVVVDKVDKNVDKVPVTKGPTSSPSRSPTITPTDGPTRAPVFVPWMSQTEGEVLLKVSLFTYESENLELEQLENRRLTRLQAADILSGSHEDLIHQVVSSMADIMCANSERLKILSVVQGLFYDYCGMLADDGGDTEKSQFQLPADLFSSLYTYLVTDFNDTETGLLNIVDRRVFISGTDGSEGDYLHWTVWSVSYPIMQLGSTVNATSEAQDSSDRIFATAVSNKVMDDLLEEKSEKVLVTSLEGWEVETFVSAIDEFKGAGKQEDVFTPIESTPSKEKYYFWQPIRIVGFALMGLLVVGVGLLMLVGHERYKYDVWDATGNGKKKNDKDVDEVKADDLNLASFEGLDFMLHSGHQMRKEAIAPPASSDPSSDDGPRMDMGNTLSELACPVQTDAAAPSSSTPRPSSARAMANSIMKTLGFEQSGHTDATQSGHDGAYSQIPSTTSNQGQGKGTPTREYGGGFHTPKALLPSEESPEESPEDFFNGFVDDPTVPSLPTISPSNTPVKRSTLMPSRKGRKKENEVLTPERSERVRPNGNDDEDYAFVTVTGKKQPISPSNTPVKRSTLMPSRKGRKKENEVLTPERSERVRPNGNDDGDYAFVTVTSKK